MPLAYLIDAPISTPEICVVPMVPPDASMNRLVLLKTASCTAGKAMADVNAPLTPRCPCHVACTVQKPPASPVISHSCTQQPGTTLMSVGTSTLPTRSVYGRIVGGVE